MSLRSLSESKIQGLSRTNSYRVSIDLIHEQEGFNARDYNSVRVKERIREYANAYKAASDHALRNPKLKLFPGDALGLWEVRVVIDPELGTKTIFLTDGHLRSKAAKLAIAEGAILTSVAVTEDRSATVAESIARTVTSQDGLKLQPLEVARVYKRLIVEEKITEHDVAALMNKTLVHVQQNLSLLELPSVILNLIDEGKVAANVARQLVQEHGVEPAIRLLKIGEELTEDNDKKITKKVIEQAKDKNLTKRKPAQRLSRKMYQSLRDHTISLSDKVWAHVPTDLSDDEEEVTVTITFNRDDLQNMKSLREIASQEKMEEREGSDEDQLPLLQESEPVVPERWLRFIEEEGNSDPQQFVIDVRERFDRVISNHILLSVDTPLSDSTVNNLWAALEDRALRHELLNIKTMRNFVKIVMSNE